MVQSMRNRDICGRTRLLDMSIDNVLNDRLILNDCILYYIR